MRTRRWERWARGLDGDGVVVCNSVVHGQAEGGRDDAVAEDVGFKEG